MKSRFIMSLALLALVSLVLLLRYWGFATAEMANVAPVSAMALCFGFYFRRVAMAGVIAFGVLVFSDVFVTSLLVRADPTLSFTELFFSVTMLVRYAVYGAFFAAAWFLPMRRSAGHLVALAPCASLAFYGVMNTVAWATSHPPFAYAKTFAGWWQSQTLGLPIPGAPPSYLFLRNALMGDLLFTGLFVALVVWIPNSRKFSTDSALKLREKAV